MVTDLELRKITFAWGQRGRKVYHSNIPSHKKISEYINNFPICVESQRGTKTAVQQACRKYLGAGYLYMVNYQICVNDQVTWIYHDGKLYLKNPGDEGIITMALLAK